MRDLAGNILLDIKGLRIEGRSGDTWSEIVKGVDLRLHRGEVLGLIGESGAGKSTVGLAAMGYVRDGCRITGGEILFDGTDLRRLKERNLRTYRGKRIAYVAQSAAASFNPAHKLIDQYCEAPLLHKVASRDQAEKDAVDIFRKVLLPDPEGIGWRYPHQVSGGQLQRAMTAMAMACRPDLIIFDEPTTALDVTTQIEVLAVIRNITRQYGVAAIYVTHDLAVVAQMADRIKVLLRGAEVEEATTDEMLAAPKEAYTRSLWAVRNLQRPAQPAPPAGAVPVLSVRGVSASYGQTRVLQDVSLDLHSRRTVAVVGESGSGKSTLARVIAGVLQPDQGEIHLMGTRLAPGYRKRPLPDLKAIQMIYQMADTALNPRQRIGEILGWPSQLYLGLTGKARTERVRELLAMIELEPDRFIDRYPGELSGGQKQRIGIARALAANPTLVLCDEVTSALDQLVAEGILKLLDRLRTELSLSYLFITHDLATVKAIADDVVVMKSGRIVEAGDKETIFSPPHAPYTQELLSSVPAMDSGWLTRVLSERKDSAAKG